MLILKAMSEIVQKMPKQQITEKCLCKSLQNQNRLPSVAVQTLWRLPPWLQAHSRGTSPSNCCKFVSTKKAILGTTRDWTKQLATHKSKSLSLWALVHDIHAVNLKINFVWWTFPGFYNILSLWYWTSSACVDCYSSHESCVLSFYLGGLWILYSQFFYYIHSSLTGHEYFHVTSHKPTSVRDNPWYIKAAGRARLLLVLSPY